MPAAKNAPVLDLRNPDTRAALAARHRRCSERPYGSACHCNGCETEKVCQYTTRACDVPAMLRFIESELLENEQSRRASQARIEAARQELREGTVRQPNVLEV